MPEQRKSHIPVTASSGNVFADIGLPEPEEELTKAQVASHIRQMVKHLRLTKTAAAERFGIAETEMSELLNGHLANFSGERLTHFLATLAQDFAVTTRAKSRGRKLRDLAVIVVTVALASCAPVQQHAIVNRSPGAENFSSAGDVMVRVNITEDLPNIFGRADLYGRKRDRGFSEIRYMGLTPDGYPIFRRRDVDILTNEDTVNRMGLGTATITAQPAGQGFVATGVSTHAPPPNVAVLPPDTTEFVLDLSRGHFITLRDKTIEIIEASPSGIRYVLR